MPEIEAIYHHIVKIRDQVPGTEGSSVQENNRWNVPLLYPSASASLTIGHELRERPQPTIDITGLFEDEEPTPLSCREVSKSDPDPNYQQSEWNKSQENAQPGTISCPNASRRRLFEILLHVAQLQDMLSVLPQI